MRQLMKIVVVMIVLLSGVSTVYALSNYLSTFVATYNASGSPLNTCTLCHNPDFSRNPFGLDFAGHGHNFAAIEALDSDGDGATNIAEIKAGTFPGDPASKPAVAPPAPTLPPPSTTPPPPTACTYTYSDWAACQPDNTQTRTVVSGTPAGCTGTPVLTQACTYVSPTPTPTPPPTMPPATGPMPAPSGAKGFMYAPAGLPSLSADPSSAYPIGLGAVASGGDSVSMRVGLGSFISPMDIYLAYSLSIDPKYIYLLKPDMSVHAVPYADLLNAIGAGTLSAISEPWKKASMGMIDEVVIDATPLATLPSSGYTFYLLASRSNKPRNFYVWGTGFTTGGDGAALYAQYCSACHGTLSSSTKIDRTAADIQNAIGAIGSMSSLSNLTATQVLAIADALASKLSRQTLGLLFPIPQPEGQKFFPQQASTLPAVNADLALARPLGVGPVASGGDAVNLTVEMGKFLNPMDVYLAFGVSYDPKTLYVMGADHNVRPVPYRDILRAFSDGSPSAAFQPWKKDSLGMIDEVLIDNVPVSQLPDGNYSLYLLAAEPGSLKNFYLWQTSFNTKPDGAALYAQYCLACHGPLPESSKIGRSAQQIQGAIAGNFGGMSSLNSLSARQIQAIADELGKFTPPPPPATTDGPTLYANNCQGCHGPLATSAKRNRTAAQIQAAINANTGGMGSLKGLTSTQVAAIAAALVSTTPPPPPPATTDGPALYANNCQGCHGPLATSAKRNRTAAQIQTAINSNTGGMGTTTLKALTSTQISAIATALVSSTPIQPAPSHPTTWYNDHRNFVEQNGTATCTSCHGADLRGGVGPSCYSCHGKTW